MLESQAWKADLDTGLEAVDGEHQLQVRLVETLVAALAAGRPRAVVGEILRRVEDTTNVHFLSEELLMRLHAYDRYAAHVEEHRVAMEQLRELRRRFDTGRDDETSEAAGQLVRWLTGHIRGADRAFGRFVAGVAR